MLAKNSWKPVVKWLVVALGLFLVLRFIVRPEITILLGIGLSPLLYQTGCAVLGALGIWLLSVVYKNSKRSKDVRESCDSLRDSLMRLQEETHEELIKVQKEIAMLKFDALKREGKFRFTRDMPLLEALKVHPDVSKLLFTQGLACVSCPSAAAETIERAAQAHGMDAESLLADLNKLLE